jgi:hypothetical protein
MEDIRETLRIQILETVDSLGDRARGVKKYILTRHKEIDSQQYKIEELEKENKILRCNSDCVTCNEWLIADHKKQISELEKQVDTEQGYCIWEYPNEDKVALKGCVNYWEDTYRVKRWKYCPHCKKEIKIKGE